MLESINYNPRTCGNPLLAMHEDYLLRQQRMTEFVAKFAKSKLPPLALPAPEPLPAERNEDGFLMPAGLARRLANPFTPETAPNPKSCFVKTIIKQACAKYGISKEDFLSIRRPKNLVQPRYEAYWLIKRNTSLTLPTIGRLLGGRDHTTILHGVRRYETARGEILRTGTISGGWDLSKMILDDGYIDIEKEGI